MNLWTVGKYEGSIYSHLWTKVHEILVCVYRPLGEVTSTFTDHSCQICFISLLCLTLSSSSLATSMCHDRSLARQLDCRVTDVFAHNSTACLRSNPSRRQHSRPGPNWRRMTSTANWCLSGQSRHSASLNTIWLPAISVCIDNCSLTLSAHNAEKPACLLLQFTVRPKYRPAGLWFIPVKRKYRLENFEKKLLK